MKIYDPLTNLQARENTYPILICLLGYFRALKAGQPVALPCGGKAEGLLRSLALSYPHPVPRDVLTETLWPDFTPAELAGILARFGNRDRRFGGVKA